MAKTKEKMAEMSEDESCDCECHGSCGYGGCGAHFCSYCRIGAVVFGILFLVAGLGLYSASWLNTNTLLGAFLLIVGIMSFVGLHGM